MGVGLLKNAVRVLMYLLMLLAVLVLWHHDAPPFIYVAF